MGPEIRRVFEAGAMVGLMTLVSGCASLSLFSNKHTHHHGVEDEAKQRIDQLEERVSALEQAQEAK